MHKETYSLDETGIFCDSYESSHKASQINIYTKDQTAFYALPRASSWKAVYFLAMSR